MAKGFRLGDGDPGKCLFALLLACPNGAAGGDATSILDKVLCVVVFREDYQLKSLIWFYNRQ